LDRDFPKQPFSFRGPFNSKPFPLDIIKAFGKSFPVVFPIT
jgi:hypothetical protein